ncbi:beta-propeller domain-containing protein [Polymorphospora lycopeni]|uniref:Beta-propeller domain-containing protein n=1 Tax=Polymorphospora lycopeni TaxID=3140240 RepID=A0ABV5CPU3_9ACTN
MRPEGRVRRRSRSAATGVLVGLTLLAGCTSAAPRPAPVDPGVPGGGFRLVAFDSCAEALAGLRTAARAYVGPWGFGGPVRADMTGGGREAVTAERAAPGAGAPDPPAFSGTNTHEAGVDEPDLVKTDGRRIVTVGGGVLHVVDPATRRVTGRLDLGTSTDDPARWADASLLLHGDRALVLVPEPWSARPVGIVPGRPGPATPLPEGTPTGPRLVLVDLAGQPRVVSDFRVDGGLVDARQVGPTARVVVRSAPRLDFPSVDQGSDDERLAANQAVIDRAPIEDWLPRWAVTDDGRTSTGSVDCGQVTRPATYSGTSMVTLFSFDLAATTLGDGSPVTVVADGDTVYSNGANLYIASDQRWRLLPALQERERDPKPEDQRTEIYQFDTTGPDRPRYVTATSVPGWLINQYAMSEWNGHLRVATTSGRDWGARPKSTSSVYVLRADGGTLRETGRVTGLGPGERIYAVRFVAGTGYVVTFRETDPLYTVDLRDPDRPKVLGELKIPGYSAYLHPVSDSRLLGIGQDATEEGRRQGTQVSLFDVGDLARPTRLAQYHVRNGNSEAEFDPHAFLYWPAERLVVVPLTTYDPGRRGAPDAGALALRVSDEGFTPVGTVRHSASTPDTHGTGMIRRSLVVGDVLWTVSDSGLQANNLSTLDTLGWVPTT